MTNPANAFELIPATNFNTTFNGLPLKDIIHILAGKTTCRDVQHKWHYVDDYVEESVALFRRVFDIEAFQYFK